MSLHLDPNSSSSEQLLATSDFIDESTQICTFGDVPIAFLPPSAIIAISSLHNISEFIDKSYITHPWPANVKDIYARTVADRAPRLFALSALFNGSHLLHDLVMVRKLGDTSLPLEHDQRVSTPWDTNGMLGAFVREQRLVCAPLFTVGRFDSAAWFRSSLPFVEARRRDDMREPAEEAVYEVKFHPEHVRGLDAERTYVLREHAREDLAAAAIRSSLFGFHCEGKYFLVAQAAATGTGK
jgi:hypothetical protein